MFFIIMLKALFGIFIIGVIGAIVIWVKDNIFTIEERQTIKNDFLEASNYFDREACSICRKKQKIEWKVCPYCGNEKELLSE